MAERWRVIYRILFPNVEWEQIPSPCKISTQFATDNFLLIWRRRHRPWRLTGYPKPRLSINWNPQLSVSSSAERWTVTTCSSKHVAGPFTPAEQQQHSHRSHCDSRPFIIPPTGYSRKYCHESGLRPPVFKLTPLESDRSQWSRLRPESHWAQRTEYACESFHNELFCVSQSTWSHRSKLSPPLQSKAAAAPWRVVESFIKPKRRSIAIFDGSNQLWIAFPSRLLCRFLWSRRYLIAYAHASDASFL